MKKLILYGLLGLFLVQCNSAKKTEDPGPPNIVFILADDLGFADLGFTGSDSHQTPNIDRLATEGTYFDYACSSQPTCQPSRISIMTGKYPARVGAVSHGSLRGVEGRGNELPFEEVTLGNALQMSGYTTAHIGKWHIGTGENGPINRGFDVDIASNQFCCPPGYFAPFVSTSHGDYRDGLAMIPDLDDREPGEYLTDCLADEAVKFIGEKHEKPFFINLAFHSVHTPLEAKEETVNKYKELIGPETIHNHAVYAAMVEHLDDGVGRVLKALEDNGLTENTLVVFTSDNGGACYQDITVNYPLRDGKASSYEGGYRVPLIIKWPGVTQAGSTCSERVVGYDFYPTFLAIAGGEGDPEHNKHVDGVDLSPLLRNPKASLAEREFHWLKYLSLIHFKIPIVDRNRCVETVIKGDWKLMEFFEMPDGYQHHFELYNLKADPSETTDLAGEFPEIVEELYASMEAWREEVDATPYEMEKFYGSVEISDQ